MVLTDNSSRGIARATKALEKPMTGGPDMKRLMKMDLSPVLRQAIKTQNPLNGE
jgi:hypothetical protein